MFLSDVNLVPNIVNPSPDYYCTWQTQLYASNDGKPEKQRALLDENALFGAEKPFGWLDFFEKARRDLLFIMDDSWDVPKAGDSEYYGSLVLDAGKFPRYMSANCNAEALSAIVRDVKEKGWKGLGGWVCAQEAPAFLINYDSVEAYWKDKLSDMKKSGFAYWKVDWGKKKHNLAFRKMLTRFARQYAPDLVVEHAVVKEIIPYSDVYRTYDVPAIMSIPMTMQKIAELSGLHAAAVADETGLGLINCEDEAYIAAAGGFTMGIMRHPYHGNFMNGSPDMSFPTEHRNLKTKIYEIIRAVRFHRVAPAFSVYDSEISVSSEILFDNWAFENTQNEIESWWLTNPLIAPFMNNGELTKKAPAAISRNAPFPEIEKDQNGNVPFCVSARNPNGVFSIATLGRTFGRKYYIPECNVTLNISNSDTIGVFGRYRNLVLKTERTGCSQIFIQDLADEVSYDVSDEVLISENQILIPGDLISLIGTMAQPEADTSEPGVIIRLIFANCESNVS